MSAPFVHEAYEELLGSPDATVVLSCEHASARLPEPWSWSQEDRWLPPLHWASDLGARALTLELAAALSASAVLARFTRLLVDPNRDPGHVDLFRRVADGKLVQLNQSIDESERARRIHGYYEPFHAALEQALARSRAPLLLSIHSFTPNYEGTVREVEIGVLFNQEEQHARALHAALAEHFEGVVENEPWSGKGGLMYCAETHAQRFGRIALELEVRQDRLEDAAYRARLVPVLSAFLQRSFTPR
jgi:predicted N-formylglutamate amidohydrolase